MFIKCQKNFLLPRFIFFQLLPLHLQILTSVDIFDIFPPLWIRSKSVYIPTQLWHREREEVKIPWWMWHFSTVNSCQILWYELEKIQKQEFLFYFCVKGTLFKFHSTSFHSEIFRFLSFFLLHAVFIDKTSYAYYFVVFPYSCHLYTFFCVWL